MLGASGRRRKERRRQRCGAALSRSDAVGGSVRVAHAPSRVLAGALAGQRCPAAGAHRLVSRDPAEVFGEGAANHTRGRVRYPKPTASFRLRPERVGEDFQRDDEDPEQPAAKKHIGDLQPETGAFRAEHLARPQREIRVQSRDDSA